MAARKGGVGGSPFVTAPSPPPPGTASLGDTPPRLLLALALVSAGGLAIVAVLASMATASVGDLPPATGLSILQRIQLGTQFVDLGLLLVVPLAVLLARLVEPSAANPSHPATPAVLTGASAIGAGLALFALLRLVADLGGGQLVVAPQIGAVFYDIGSLLVAVGGAYWAYRELRRVPAGSTAAPAAPVPPPLPTVPPGFPQGPPPAPGPPPPPPAR